MSLIEEQYNELEDFIQKTESENYINAISHYDLENGKNIYNLMKTEKGPKYEIFGSDGCGYHCYALYKARNDNIYFIYVSIQTLKNWKLIESESFFGTF